MVNKKNLDSICGDAQSSSIREIMLLQKENIQKHKGSGTRTRIDDFEDRSFNH